MWHHVHVCCETKMPEFRSIVVGRLSMPAEAPLHLDLNARAKKVRLKCESPLKWIVYWKNTQSICVQPRFASRPLNSFSLLKRAACVHTHWAMRVPISPVLTWDACPDDVQCACSSMHAGDHGLQFRRRRIDCDSAVLHYQSKAINWMIRVTRDPCYAPRNISIYLQTCDISTAGESTQCISHTVCRIELLWLWVVRGVHPCALHHLHTYKMTFSITTLFARFVIMRCALCYLFKRFWLCVTGTEENTAYFQATWMESLIGYSHIGLMQ